MDSSTDAKPTLAQKNFQEYLGRLKDRYRRDAHMTDILTLITLLAEQAEEAKPAERQP